MRSLYFLEVEDPSEPAAVSVWQPAQRAANSSAPRWMRALSPRDALSSIPRSPHAVTPAAAATRQTAEMAARRRGIGARNTNPVPAPEARMPAPEADRQRFRAVMGHFPTGVAVVTARDERAAVGMTTNALTSLSLDPLLLLVCFDGTSRTLPVVRETRRFAVNVLRAGQEALAGRFASKLPLEEKFGDVSHRDEGGVPVLDGVLAWMACDLERLLPGGDHEIGIGAVTSMGHADGGAPLVWYRGAYTAVTERWTAGPPGSPARR